MRCNKKWLYRLGKFSFFDLHQMRKAAVSDYLVMCSRRTDRLTAVQVDLAVNVAAVFGMGAGVRVLHAEGIPPAVVQRVIIDGGPRRGDGRASAPSSLPPAATGGDRPQ